VTSGRPRRAGRDRRATSDRAATGDRRRHDRAGDAFNGGGGLAAGHELTTALSGPGRRGLAVTRPGAQEAMPRRAEVRALLGR
jgi:hypothetical protein